MPIFDFCDSLENSPTNRKTKAPKPFSDFGAVFSIPARQGAEDCLVVPSARLELAQLSPLPPQDSVSTNFTTTADLFATACCILREPFKNNSAQQHPSKQAVIVIAILRGTMGSFQFLPWVSTSTPRSKQRVTPCTKSLARRRRVTGNHGSGIAAGRCRRSAGSRRCCASRRSRCRTGCRRCSRGQGAQHAGRARGIGTIAVIGQYQRASKKDGCQHGRCAREECGAARRAEQAAGCAAAECCASCGPFALLHEDQTDHDQGTDDLNHQQDIEKYVHEKSESCGMCFTCSSTQRRAFYFAAATMAKKASALSDAPPISPPSMSGCANSSAALPAFMLPPYRMRIEFA